MELKDYMELPYTKVIKEINDESGHYYYGIVLELDGCQSTGDTLEEMSRVKRGLFIKTNRALFHARAGAWIEIDLSDVCGMRIERGQITSLVLRYKKDAAFETAVTVTA